MRILHTEIESFIRSRRFIKLKNVHSRFSILEDGINRISFDVTLRSIEQNHGLRITEPEIQKDHGSFIDKESVLAFDK